MSDNNLTVVAYFLRDGAGEKGDAPTYWERIKPTLMPAEGYFADVEPKAEWHKRHEEKALSDFYGAEIEVTTSK